MAGGRLQTNVSISEPATGSVLVQVRSTTQRIYVQYIIYSPSDFVAGTVLSFIDSLTLQSIGVISVAGITSQYPLDFGYAGTALSVGASLLLSIISGGATGRLRIDAYQLPLMSNATYVAPHTAGFTA